MVGHVVSELHNSNADVRKNAGHFGIIAQHGTILKTQKDAQDVIFFGGFHFFDAAHDAHQVSVLASKMTPVSDTSHGPCGVFPNPAGGVHNVYAPRTDLFNNRAIPIVYF